MALLMVQYLTGGKWGLVMQRPLEAMSRTLPLVFGYWLIVALGMKRLYLWAAVGDGGTAWKSGWRSEAHVIDAKRALLNPTAFVVVSVFCFVVWGLLVWRLDALSLRRDEDALADEELWRQRFENISGPGLIVYALTVTATAILWVMSLDARWSSSVYGLMLLVGQGYAVLALGTITVVSLAQDEPMKSMLRTEQQRDLGKLAFAFVLLNMYLAFSQFLIIWSGNLPDEIGWYLDRTRGHWNVVVVADFVLQGVIPFVLLLSRDLKSNRKRLVRVCQWMIVAKALDLFWLIEPNFPDAARNLHFSWGILEYGTVPVAMTALWVAFYCMQLQRRPLIARNDARRAEMEAGRG
jgi:hypothetical protein